MDDNQKKRIEKKTKLENTLDMLYIEFDKLTEFRENELENKLNKLRTELAEIVEFVEKEKRVKCSIDYVIEELFLANTSLHRLMKHKQKLNDKLDELHNVLTEFEEKEFSNKIDNLRVELAELVEFAEKEKQLDRHIEYILQELSCMEAKEKELAYD